MNYDIIKTEPINIRLINNRIGFQINQYLKDPQCPDIAKAKGDSMFQFSLKDPISQRQYEVIVSIRASDV